MDHRAGPPGLVPVVRARPAFPALPCGGAVCDERGATFVRGAVRMSGERRYCRFYTGRRTEDDERQISRWRGVCGPKARWISQGRDDALRRCPRGCRSDRGGDGCSACRGGGSERC